MARLMYSTIHRKRMVLFFLTLLLAGTVAVISGQDQGSSAKGIALDREDFVFIHMEADQFAVANCVGCHGNRYDDVAPLDASVKTGHALMLQLKRSSAGEVTADDCRECHKSVDLYQNSAAHIRKQVSMEGTFMGQNCVDCHGASSDAPLFQATPAGQSIIIF